MITIYLPGYSVCVLGRTKPDLFRIRPVLVMGVCKSEGFVFLVLTE